MEILKKVAALGDRISDLNVVAPSSARIANPLPISPRPAATTRWSGIRRTRWGQLDRRTATAVTEEHGIPCEPEAMPGRLDVRRELEALGAQYLPDILALCDQVAGETLPAGSPLGTMMQYQQSTGGKRIRALLPLLVAKLQGVDPAQLVPFSAACETLHSASLVHDDLQDGDERRRGRPTVWHKYGAAQALILGDSLQNLASTLVLELDVQDDVKLRALRWLFVHAMRTMDGQSRELELCDAPTSYEGYFTAVEGKTSALFSLPLIGAAVLCGASGEVVAGLGTAACHLGILFQVQDDLLDLYGDKGRGFCGSDIREGKRSLLVVHALLNLEQTEADELRALLDKERNATTVEDVATALALLEQTGSKRFAVEEITARKQQILDVPELSEYPSWLALLSGLCDQLLVPIRGLLEPGR